jgi:hypothetical protein
MAKRAPILDHKNHREPSVFDPKALLREARRQKNLTVQDVPAVCILDPDGDVVRHLKASGKAHRVASWPCYHTELHSFDLAGETVGIVGYAVGAPFAVLVVKI